MSQNMGVAGYLASDVNAAFRKSGNRLRFRYEWLDYKNSTKGILPNISPGGSITHSTLSTIKRTCAFSMTSGLDPGFKFSSDRIRPWIGVQMSDGGWADFPQGIFLIDSPDTKFSGGLITRDCSGKDQALILNDDIQVSRYVIAAGVAYTDAIQALLVNVPSVKIVESTLTLPVARNWDPGTSSLQILNDLLAAINYTSLWFDGYGVAQVQPYVEPGVDTVDVTYSDVGNKAFFTPEVTTTLDLSAVPNYIVYTVSQPSRPVLVSKWENKDPSSPVSSVSRGRRIVKFDSSLDVATQAQLDVAVRRAGINAANVYQKIQFSTPILPIHENRDILLLQHSDLGITANFAETDWKIELKAGGQMSHTARRVINLDANLIGTPDDA